MRPVRRFVLALLVVLLAAGLIWGPSYARSLSLVVRAAEMDGWLRRAAEAEARPWTAGPERTIPTRHGDIPARIHRPEGDIRRAVVLTPGVHAMGIEEPRLKRLAGDLAASGVVVMTIALPDLMQYRFTAEATDQIEDAAAWLAARRDLAPGGEIGLMGVSFAGGLSIVAAGRAAIRDRVAFVFSFGGHGDLPRVLRYLCTGRRPLPPDAPPGASPTHQPPHDYGVAVILIGLADRMVPPDQVAALRHGIETFLTASQLTLVDMDQARATYEESRRIAASLPEPSATLLRMVNARDTRALGAELLPVLESIDLYPASLSPERSPAPISPVYLLHGRDDTVIPAVETELLAHDLEVRGVDVHALLSELITHAEVDRTAALRETWRLVAFWAGLLSE